MLVTTQSVRTDEDTVRDVVHRFDEKYRAVSSESAVSGSASTCQHSDGARPSQAQAGLLAWYGRASTLQSCL